MSEQELMDTVIKEKVALMEKKKQELDEISRHVTEEKKIISSLSAEIAALERETKIYRIKEFCKDFIKNVLMEHFEIEYLDLDFHSRLEYMLCHESSFFTGLCHSSDYDLNQIMGKSGVVYEIWRGYVFRYFDGIVQEEKNPPPPRMVFKNVNKEK